MIGKRKLWKCAVMPMAVIALSQISAANATVLHFGDAGTCASSCSNGSIINQAFGDEASVVDISYRTSSLSGGSGLPDGNVQYWGMGYGDLSGVAYSLGLTEIIFSVAQGNSLLLKSLDFASFTNAANTRYRVFDLNYNLLLDSGVLAATNVGHSVYSFDFLEVAGGAILQVGDEADAETGAQAYNVGLNNIRYSVIETSTPAVPEPASWTMMIAGIGLVGGLARRSARLVAFA